MSQQDTLYILWTTDNPITVQHMIFMYADNSLRNKWWAHVHIIVWGAAAKLLSEDKNTQNELHKFLEEGGRVSICRRCAEKLNVVTKLEALEDMGDVKLYYVGDFFTQTIKSGAKIITV